MAPFNFIRLMSWIYIVVLLSSCDPKKPKTFPAVAEQDPLSKTIYVGEMYYFQETEEFYTSVYFHPDLDERDSESVVPFLDSTIYADANLKRMRLPIDKAEKTFMLSGLDSLFIYDTNHTFISKATFLRVEYLQDGVEDRFIAVYKGDKLKTDPAEQYYCINKIRPDLQINDFSYKTINDPSLNGFIIHRLKVRPEINWRIENIEILPYRATYSVVTSREESFITELKDNQFTVLKNMNGEYRIDHILPLPFEVNGRPLLLTSLYIPGVAPRYTSLAVFTDIEEYRILNNNRLRIK